MRNSIWAKIRAFVICRPHSQIGYLKGMPNLRMGLANGKIIEFWLQSEFRNYLSGLFFEHKNGFLVYILDMREMILV